MEETPIEQSTKEDRVIGPSDGPEVVDPAQATYDAWKKKQEQQRREERRNQR